MADSIARQSLLEIQAQARILMAQLESAIAAGFDEDGNPIESNAVADLLAAIDENDAAFEEKLAGYVYTAKLLKDREGRAKADRDFAANQARRFASTRDRLLARVAHVLLERGQDAKITTPGGAIKARVSEPTEVNLLVDPEDLPPEFQDVRPAIGALRKALESNDPQVRSRAEKFARVAPLPPVVTATVYAN